ncbi:MAG: valine--tRNA ligase [Patescibacteria group bacterium]
MPELEKAYNPKAVEDGIYEKWEKSGYFNPDNLSRQGRPYSIVMPPPNVTGTLHLGHAVMLAIEDILIRYHRMRGDRTLWLPGTDHAAIATQTKVEKILKEREGKTRHDLGREKFLAEVDKFITSTKSTIKNQIRKMGSSCDWSREAYTLDEPRSRAVRTVFKMMHDDGLIYRGERIVNWCPGCGSTLADDEVEYKTQKAKFYTFKYSKDFPFAIATTRPETKLGDMAVAVNPEDSRYKKYVGKTYEVNFVGVPLKIKIIADRSIDMVFGTGALGVTPAHSTADWQMAEKNDLPIIKVIDEQGKIRDGFTEYSGKSTTAAREMIVEKIKTAGLLEKEEEIENNLSICYRCGTPVEPLPSLQWFIDVNKKIKKYKKSLKELSLEAVKKGVFGQKKIEIIPEQFEKVYFHWMENLRDWCISRQIWFGHRVPVWYKEKEIYVGIEAPQGEGWTQDPDTLDTWFSSGLWTFSTLGWPEKTKDLKNFHPTAVLETGYDILFFWIARMILMTTYVLGDIPFKNVYLHGLVRDEKGKKMSKSLGNIIDPLDMIEKYGTDAVRLSLVLGTSPGNDMKLSDEKIAGFRNFTNKLWNISRYILMNVKDTSIDTRNIKPKERADKWILYYFNELKSDQVKKHKDFGQVSGGVTGKLNVFQFSNAGFELRNFTWSQLADHYLEMAKGRKDKVKDQILIYILKDLLKLWHPFMPFVTEHIWQMLGEKEMLIVQEWPKFDKRFEKFKKEAKLFEDEMLLANAGKEKIRLEKELAEAEKYLGILENKLSNKEFLANAPKELVAGEKEKLESQKEKVQKIKDQLKTLS